MKAICIKADPLNVLVVGQEYVCLRRFKKVHIPDAGMVVSEEVFEEHFAVTMVLHLILKQKWYRMIERGEKTEEYRDIKPFWIKRLCYSHRHGTCYKPRDIDCERCIRLVDPLLIDNFTHVCFHLGYTRETMTKEIKAITDGYGRPEWGAPKGKKVFIIKFKEGGEL